MHTAPFPEKHLFQPIPYPKLFSYCCDKHYDQQLGKEKVYFILQVTIHHWGEPRQGCKAVAWRQELDQRPWWGAAYWLDPFLYLPEPPAMGKPQGKLNPPTAVINQENISTDLSPGHFNGGIISTEISSSQVTLICDKM